MSEETENQPMETPLEDLMNAALKDYEDAADKAHHFNSAIPTAIRFYFEHEIRESRGLKTSTQWNALDPDLTIMDPDGWDRNNYVYSFYRELITRGEFYKRVVLSTCTRKQAKPTGDAKS